jgi:phosphatidylglycerophosphate synthase
MMAVSPDPGSDVVAKPPERPQLAAWIGLLFALAVCVVVVLMVLAPFFSVILLAVVASGLIRPSYRRLVEALNGRKRAAGILICVILLMVLLVPLYLIAQEVSQEALGIYEMSTTQLTSHSVSRSRSTAFTICWRPWASASAVSSTSQGCRWQRAWFGSCSASSSGF